MKLLKVGTKHKDVVTYRNKLVRLGYDLGPKVVRDEELYTPQLEVVTRRFQFDHKLGVDGKVGTIETWPTLDKALGVVCPEIEEDNLYRDDNTNGVEKRLQSLINASRHIYYGGAHVGVWKEEQRGETDAYMIPDCYKVEPGSPASKDIDPHGMTCGHWAWRVLSYYLCAYFPEKDIYPTWRTGRSCRWVWTLPVKGKIIKGSVHRGHKEYCKRVRWWRYSALSGLYKLWDKLGTINVIEYGSHCGIILKVEKNDRLRDPRYTNDAVKTEDCYLRPGLYDFSANGWYPKWTNEHGEKVKGYSGSTITLRRLPEYKEKRRKHIIVAVQRMTSTGTAPDGPLAKSSGVRYPIKFDTPEQRIDY